MLIKFFIIFFLRFLLLEKKVNNLNKFNYEKTESSKIKKLSYFLKEEF